VLTASGEKEYLPATAIDVHDYQCCSARLDEELKQCRLQLPDLPLAEGYNTRQAMNYGFTCWRDFFNDRQLLALAWLRAAIEEIADAFSREALRTLFSGTLEFNNLFASYKGEGTGAVRHMFAHHILKPERMPIEANVWGTPKSSGSFSGLFRTRLLRAVQYRLSPTEVTGKSGKGLVCAPPFSGKLEDQWPIDGALARRGLYLSCGDSATTGLPDHCLDLVVTDPPFFDNVHYSELADFFYAWQKAGKDNGSATTRNLREVQDADPDRFAEKLSAVLRECCRVLKDEGLLVFSYHHSRDEGWNALARAVLGAGFVVVNAHPVKGEMSVATPKAQAKDPIQLDIILVCSKRDRSLQPVPLAEALTSAKAKIARLCEVGLKLSGNDQKVVLYGQLLTTVTSVQDSEALCAVVEREMAARAPQVAYVYDARLNNGCSAETRRKQKPFDYRPLFEEHPSPCGDNAMSVYRYLTITQGNLDNRHFYLTEALDIFPNDVFGGADASQSAPRTLRVECGNEVVETDIDRTKNIFRKRGWVGRFFDANRVMPGDIVCLEQIEPYRYRVAKAADKPQEGGTTSLSSDKRAAKPSCND
jgi:putative DNA methylase